MSILEPLGNLKRSLPLMLYFPPDHLPAQPSNLPEVAGAPPVCLLTVLPSTTPVLPAHLRQTLPFYCAELPSRSRTRAARPSARSGWGAACSSWSSCSPSWRSSSSNSWSRQSPTLSSRCSRCAREREDESALGGGDRLLQQERLRLFCFVLALQGMEGEHAYKSRSRQSPTRSSRCSRRAWSREKEPVVEGRWVGAAAIALALVSPVQRMEGACC